MGIVTAPTLLLSQIPSPVGTILLVSDGAALRAVDFSDYEDRLRRLLRLYYGPHTIEPSPAGPAADSFAAYFAGDLAALDAIPTTTAGTPFQRLVWQALRAIPPGDTISYGRLAAQIGRPGASRAVGLANGANPLSIIVPCHRVVGADATLTGYGGGLARKQWLITHERSHARHHLALQA